jgi:hydroxymethylpyrimidine/phosphomethylpyrimidine kinase
MSPVVATIAGSDSSGGAGIQADLRTFAAHGVRPTTIVTAVTAQDDSAVHGVFLLTPVAVAAQLRAVTGGFGHAAVKIGMLGNAKIVRAVLDGLDGFGDAPIVVDPVLESSSGTRLIDPGGAELVRRVLIPRAFLVTPNLAEASGLGGRPVHSVADMREAARIIHDMGARHVLVTGGHLAGRQVVDVFFDGRAIQEFERERIPASLRGTGCILSAAIAARLALGDAVADAVEGAADFTAESIRRILVSRP